MSVAPFTDTNSIVLADLTQAKTEPWKRTSADGVTLALAQGSASSEVALVVTNAGKVSRKGAWVRLERRFEPLLNLKQQQGLGLEVEGDGSGALLAIRLESPHVIAYGAVADRYLPLDFTGRRSVRLVETESTRWSDYVWNDGKGAYNVYRETIDFKAVESVSVWLQNVAPQRESKCRIGPIRALPLRAGTVKNPKLTVGSEVIEFPVELASGNWLEANGPEDCQVYGSKGEPLGKVTPRGHWPTLRAGVTDLQFSAEPCPGPDPRAQVTLFSYGEAL
jgi:hypothetical protein